MKPCGRAGVFTLGVNGIPIVDNVCGLLLCEKPCTIKRWRVECPAGADVLLVS
jgi:hypothetical protein